MISDHLVTPGAPEPKPTRPSAPPGWTPGFEWDGSKGNLTTTGLVGDRPKTWDAFILDAGLDPAEVSVVGPVQVRGWDAPKAGGDIVRMHYYRLTLARRGVGESIEELVALVRRARRRKPPVGGPVAFVFAPGDLQLGKMDGDGAAGTVQRFEAAVVAGAERVAALRKAGTPVGHVHLAFLGDCVEGFTSQGGANAWRTTLTVTEQIRLLRRLMLLAVETFAPLAPRVTLVSVPGNHDEALRPTTRYDDSFAVEAAVQVADAIAFNPRVFGHVQTIVPGRDELTVTCDVAGTVITHAHGHKWARGKHWEWWQGQAFGDHAPGAASVLLCGHLHHLMVTTSGNKTVMQVTALESESTWWRHKTGEAGNPGVVSFTTRGGGWSDLAVL